MDRMILTLLICLAVPLLLFAGVLRGRGRRLLLFLVIGMAACVPAAYLNTAAQTALGCSSFYLSTAVSPVVEECLKQIPVFIAAALSLRRREDILTAAFELGIGFALFENVTMMLQNAAAVTVLWAVLRGVGTAMMHGLTTAMVGLTAPLMWRDRRMLFCGAFSMLSLAIVYHGTYNCLIQIPSLRWFGICLPLCTCLGLFLLRRYLRKAAGEREEEF